MKILTALSAAALLLAAGSSAQAAVYSVAGDFGTSVFSYGSGVGGTPVFTPYLIHSACATGLDCYSNGGEPLVAKNISSTDYAVGTVNITAGAVDFHPGPEPLSLDSIIRFIAPTAGQYAINGAFTRFDVTSNGNGVNASIFSNIGGVSSQLFTTFLSPASYGSSTAFTGLTANLGAGDTIDFVVNNNGGYVFDSTGVGATLSANVPEPASWALMIVGFGATGALLRRRRPVLVRA